jgi:hypothetical protein
MTSPASVYPTESWQTHVESKFEQSKANILPLVEVLWLDATAQAVEWQEELDNEVCRTVSCGYLVHHDETATTIVTIVNAHHVAHALTIPAGCIVELRYVG